MTKTTVTVGGALLMAVAAAAVVKLNYFPTVKEAYFKPDFDNLRTVPAGIVAVRPTHTTHSTGDPIRNMIEHDSLVRAVGRDVTLRDLMAEAYDCKPGLVVLPADAPQGHFDFLVTVGANPLEHLQSAVRRKLGYAAHHETRETDVLKLTMDSNWPSLATSPDSEGEHIEYKNGKLIFTHKSLKLLLDGLEDGLALPVLDETGLTGRYDFSLPWSDAIYKKMQDGAFDLEGVQKVLRSLGLRLEPGTARVDLLIVEKTR